MDNHDNEQRIPTDKVPGLQALRLLEIFGLVLIAICTVIAAGQDIAIMVEHRRVTLADLLLLFIYLEILAMVALYAESGKLPVRMPLYIGMVALARYLIIDIKELDNWRILIVATAILVLAASVLLVRVGRSRFQDQESQRSAWKKRR